jgi:hypothetical protein
MDGAESFKAVGRKEEMKSQPESALAERGEKEKVPARLRFAEAGKVKKNPSVKIELVRRKNDTSIS